ncbi:MAG: DNA mismatch repair endonuclease MutL [Bacteroidales bacterium]|nr:DNA mismatch repair endonuclease MutL [Bacteroidales bacterium]
MPDIIQILPDSVANQIAAGEVIQRPASVVKELVENAIDAGSTEIKVVIKDSGKTLIQIIDNGCGMSETDARLAFERHATSKIKTANDLYCIRTMGFRGEALASVAAIAHVELKTKKVEDEIGTSIIIHGSELISQESISCPDGSNFIVKNLFYNVPARRKFLKTNSTELRHIIEEIQRIALSNPDIKIILINNSVEIYNLPVSNLKQRIVNILGKSSSQNLITIKSKTSLVEISGYVGKPEFARKRPGEQFFFVNKRYMRHPYFYRAVLKAYEKILPQGTIPSFFIYFSADPNTIDINIHPTKTEIKFEDEKVIWQIIMATVKEALGKFNIVPSIDFDQQNALNIPVFSGSNDIKAPEITINPDYNPFEANHVSKNANDFLEQANLESREKLYTGIEDVSDTENQQLDFVNPENINEHKNLFQLKNKYIITSVKSGMMIIDQKRAHERILFEMFIKKLKKNIKTTQKKLFPVSIELNTSHVNLFKDILDDLRKIGFEISLSDNNNFEVSGVPSELLNLDVKEYFDGLIKDLSQETININEEITNMIISSLAKASAINYRKYLTNEEISNLIDNLFACSEPSYTPDGRIIVNIISEEEITKKFK